MTRVLVVCLGNICRSPTAEAAIREAAADEGLDLEVDSAGTSGWHDGHPPDPRSRAAAAEAGLDVSGESRRITPEDFARHDLVIAMDRRNLADLEELAPDDEARSRLRLFRAYAGEADQDVPDPYYGGADGFREVVAICRRAASGLVHDLATDVAPPE